MWKKIVPLLALAPLLGAQTYTISTLAGGGPGIGQAATSYGLNTPTAVAADSSGNLYVAVYYQCQVWVVNSTGLLSQVIGNGSCGFSGDGGPAGAASLNNPYGVAADNSGNVYIADTGNARIRKVSGGIITTVAGTGTQGFSGDGISATSAQLAYPAGVAVDTFGNLYIADTYNFRIRRVSNGIITTVAGNGTEGYNGDNISATSAELDLPWAVALDGSGNLYIADTSNNRIREVSGGTITTVAGSGAYGYNGDNMSATSAALDYPYGVALDGSGNIYIADTYNYRVRKVSGGIITTAGFGLSIPQGVATAGNNVYVADTGNNRIGKLSSGGVTTVVGNGLIYSGDGGAATSAELLLPYGMAVDGGGNLFIADSGDCVVRKLPLATGIISTVAGNGVCGYNGDNMSATSAELASPTGVAVDNFGNLFIADSGNNRVRRVSGGIISTVAGIGWRGYNGDNFAANSAALANPFGVAVDTSGNLFIADSGNNRVRRVSGVTITTVAGNGTPGYNGDDKRATSAELNIPLGVAADNAGNLFIADTYNQRIRKVSGGIITTVAGNGILGYGDNISATAAELGHPFGVVVDGSGNLFIADADNERVRKVSGGIISSIGGNGTAGYSGDGGPGAAAELNNPSGVALDSSGNVYVADLYNNRVRKLQPGGFVAVTVTSVPSGLTVFVDGNQTTTPYTFDWTAGSCHTFNAITQSLATGIQYVPAGTFPASPCFASAGSYNVNFTTQYYLTTSTGTGGTILPSSGYYNAGTSVSISATPSAGYLFAGFSGALTGAINPQSITMNAPASVMANFLSLANYSISGQVTMSGVGLGGVTINVVGAATTSANTNSSGNYSLSLPGGGTYTLTASLAGYTFSAPVSLSNLGSNQIVNFAGTAALDFYPVTPCRIADTRTGSGFSGQFGPPSMGGGATRLFNILSSPCAAGIPASVAAYSLNFTVVPPPGGPAANLTTWPVGVATGIPNVSTLNYYDSVVANAAIVPAGANGAIDVYASYPTDMLFDINGYFAPPLSSGLEFYPVTPCRIADTRSGAGFSGQFGPPAMIAGANRGFSILSSPCAAGIPASVAAYSLNFTAVPPAGGPASNLTVWAGGALGRPNVSTLNYYGNVVANAAIVPAGAGGAISTYAVNPTDLLFDINGYFAPASSSGFHFYPVTPCRIADTRTGAGFSGQFGPPSIAGGATRTFNVLSSPCATSIPATVAAYSLNFTVVPSAGGPESNLTTWPSCQAVPNVSTLNFHDKVVAGAAIVPTCASGGINVFLSNRADVLFDINGYFAP